MTEIIITSSVLILVIAAVRWLLRGEFPLRLQYALWALAAVRLLVPVSFASSAFSVLNVAPSVELPDRGSIYVSDQGVTAQQPPPQIGYANSSVGVDGEYVAGDRYELYYPPNSNDWVFVPVGEAAHEGFTTVPASRILPTSKAALTAVWYTGMAVMGGWFLWVNLSFRKRLRAAERKVELPDCPLPVYVAEGLPSPCLFGLLRPAIYVTPACLEDEDRLRHVLAHELTHARHGDPFWSLVRCVCLTVYWFDPLVWLAAALSRRDCELACDEGTLAKLGEEERTAYGRTLIGLMAQSASPSYLLHTATTMVDRKRGAKERLLLIAKKPMTLAITTAAVLLIAGIAVACTFTGAAEPSDGYASVEEALADVPEEFRRTDSIAEGVSVFTPEARPSGIPDSLVEAALEEGELFRAYSKFHIAISSNLEDPLGWMASVYRMDQAAYDGLAEARGITGRTLNSYWECFAKDSDSYYLIYAPLTAPERKEGQTEGAQLQTELIAWIKEAVASVQGVTAFGGGRWEVNAPFYAASSGGGMYNILGYDADAVTWRPPGGVLRVGQLYFANPRFLGSFFQDKTVEGSAELKDGVLRVGFTVGADAGSGTVDGPHAEFHVDGDGLLVDYDFTDWEGSSIALSEDELIHIASVLREIIQYMESGLVGLFNEESDRFAQDQNAPQLPGTAQDAFILLLNGDNSLLTDGPEARAWIDFGYDRSQLNTELGFVYADVDGDGVIELYLQNTLGPEVLNAVFDYQDGAIRCWRFDIMDGSEFQYLLTDGVMVREIHFSDAVTYRIFRYTHTGEETDLGSLAYTPAGGFSGDNGEPASWKVDGQTVTEEEFNSALAERITGKLLTRYYAQWELERLRGSISVAPDDADWPAGPTPAAIARVLSEKYFGAYTQVSPNSFYHLDSVEVIDIAVFDMDDLFTPTDICFHVTVALAGKVLDDMGGWQAGQGMDYQQDGLYAGKWIQGWDASAMMDSTGRWRFTGAGSGGFAVDYDGVFLPDIYSCRDDELMYFLLNVADGACTESAQYQLGERFLARPGGILNAMTCYRGVETVRWPDFGDDGADWLVSALVSEFKVMRPPEDADRFVAALDQFTEEDYGGMVRSVREAWDSYVRP